MLEEIISSGAKRKILVLLLTNSEKQFFVRDICRKTFCNTNEAKNVLESFEKIGLVFREKKGNMIFFQSNRNCPIFEELKQLVLKTNGLGNFLKKELENIEKIRFAFVYGSFASNSEKKHSDIDLLVIGHIEPKSFVQKIRKAEKQIGREINYLVFSEEEFLKKIKKGFIANVLAGKKIMIVGKEHEFKRFIEGKQSQKNSN